MQNKLLSSIAALQSTNCILCVFHLYVLHRNLLAQVLQVSCLLPDGLLTVVSVILVSSAGTALTSMATNGCTLNATVSGQELAMTPVSYLVVRLWHPVPQSLYRRVYLLM